MRTVYVQELMRLPLGKQGENGAARIVWQGLAARYQALYGSGAFTLTAKRCGDAAAYPVAVSTEGGDVVWLVRAADVASPGSGSCELTYTVDGAVAKSQTWSTYVAASISGDAPGEPPEEPAKAWFAAIQAQIGNLDDLTTKARASLVTAVNEAAKTGSGGAGSISMRTADGYIQYSTDGVTWENLIAVATLEGKPGKDGHTPKIAATKTGKTTSITADGVEIAQIKDGEDAAADPSLGITGAQVGQIAKITAVDASGVPTAWSPVDMAGGETKPYKILYNQTLSEAAVVKVDADADAVACNEYILSMAIPKGDAAVYYNAQTIILCTVKYVNNIPVVDASYGTLHQAHLLKAEGKSAWLDFSQVQTTSKTPSLATTPRTGWNNMRKSYATDLSPILYDSKVELPVGTIIIIGGR